MTAQRGDFLPRFFALPGAEFCSPTLGYVGLKVILSYGNILQDKHVAISCFIKAFNDRDVSANELASVRQQSLCGANTRTETSLSCQSAAPKKGNTL